MGMTACLCLKYLKVSCTHSGSHCRVIQSCRQSVLPIDWFTEIWMLKGVLYIQHIFTLVSFCICVSLIVRIVFLDETSTDKLALLRTKYPVLYIIPYRDTRDFPDTLCWMLLSSCSFFWPPDYASMVKRSAGITIIPHPNPVIKLVTLNRETAVTCKVFLSKAVSPSGAWREISLKKKT